MMIDEKAPGTKPMRLARISLPLLDETWETDLAQVTALRHLKGGWFTSVIFTVPSWPEVPHAVMHPLVRLGVDLATAAHLCIYLGRRCYVTYPDRCPADMKQWRHAGAYADSAYYARMIQQVKEEVEILDIEGCGLDMEMHAKCPDKFLKEYELVQDEVTDIKLTQAIRSAVQCAGQVDIVGKVDSGRPSSVNWRNIPIGKLGISGKSRYAHGLDDLPTANPPEGTEHQIDLWESDCSVTPPLSKKLVPTEIMFINMAPIREEWPGCGQSVHFNPEDGAEALKAFAK